MGIFKLEHSRGAYFADFATYGLAVASLALWLLTGAPFGQGWQLVGLIALGLLAWTLTEYLFHRFLLHGMQPFKGWHAVHHQKPMALIFTPTLLSAALMLGLVFLPALLAGGMWRASALTLGMLIGYLVYGLAHHATHHWRSGNAWLKKLKLWHAMHHHAAQPGCYGVTSPLWDHVFGSTGRAARKHRSGGV